MMIVDCRLINQSKIWPPVTICTFMAQVQATIMSHPDVAPHCSPCFHVTALSVCSQHSSAVELIKCHHQSDHIIPLLKTFQAPTTTRSKPLCPISLTRPRPPRGYDALAFGVWTFQAHFCFRAFALAVCFAWTIILSRQAHKSQPSSICSNMASSKRAYLLCPKQCYFFHGIY